MSWIEGELSGDWVDYFKDMETIGAKHQPKSMCVIGAGWFFDVRAIAKNCDLETYLGVDREFHREAFDSFRLDFPKLQAGFVETDLYKAKVIGDFDLVILDAHGFSERRRDHDYDEITTAQCRMVYPFGDLRAKVLVIDDCRVETTAEAAIRFFGQPTMKMDGCTSAWVWEMK